MVDEESLQEHNKEIEEATKYLQDVVVPSFVKSEFLPDFEEAFRKGEIENYPLVRSMHSKGINVRYLVTRHQW